MKAWKACCAAPNCPLPDQRIGSLILALRRLRLDLGRIGGGNRTGGNLAQIMRRRTGAGASRAGIKRSRRAIAVARLRRRITRRRGRRVILRRRRAIAGCRGRRDGIAGLAAIVLLSLSRPASGTAAFTFQIVQPEIGIARSFSSCWVSTSIWWLWVST